MSIFNRLLRSGKDGGRNSAAEVGEPFVTAAYRAVLRRDPDSDGLKDYCGKLARGELTAAALLDELRQSDEFKALSAPTISLDDDHTNRNPMVVALSSDDILQRSSALATYAPFTESHIDKAAGGLVGLEYYELHKRRFLEMINALAFIERELATPLDILEIGTIFTTYIIKSTFPYARISTVDVIDLDNIGYGDVYSLKDIVEQHHHVDLVRDPLDDIAINGGEQFSVVLMCEVIEHLLLNPAKLLRFVLRQLKPGGYLYMTTPNAFKHANVQAMRRAVNPFEIYPETFSYDDAHMFHVREYGMGELLNHAERAGGVVKAFYFSSCWDDADAVQRLPDHELSNLVVLIQKP